MDEQPLLGGNTHDAVVRVGDTVRRPAGPWTPGVHALLGHLGARGFDGSPRALGLDDQGREIVTYIAGPVVHPDHESLLAPDEALASVAALIRAFHDAVADFPGTQMYEWSDRGRDPCGSSELLCHNDLATWNLIAREGGGWAFIDWDGAAPGRRAWDIGWALTALIPLLPGSGLGTEHVMRRLGVFTGAYGRDLLPADVLGVAVERCRHEAERIEERGSVGEAPYDRLLADGHARAWSDAADHVAERATTWSAALRGSAAIRPAGSCTRRSRP